jgi:AraC-like DNA-binding protein
MYFERGMLELPFQHADALAGQRFRQAFERRMAAEGDPFAVAVQNAIAAQIASGEVSQAGIAKQFAMTPRTLQRRLRERNLHYQELLLEARKQAALRLLAERSRSVCEVAMAIGYEVSSFNRQFRRWTGMTPSAFRNAQACTALR